MVFGRYNLEPFRNWKVTDKVLGLDWWMAHNESKHDGYRAFRQCNLKNCVNAIASLIILNLYLVQSQIDLAGEINDIRDICRADDLGEFTISHYCGNYFRTMGECKLP